MFLVTSNVTWRTFTKVSSHTVVTGPTVETHLLLAVVLVRLAVLADVAVDADALVAALRVLTRAVVLARVVVGALVHVPRAVAVSPGGRALAGVGADAVHAAATVLAQVALAVIDILLAVVAGETLTKIHKSIIFIDDCCSMHHETRVRNNIVYIQK